ncbi:hypothetical protein GEV33_013862 [Tenebrio molitor]|uniref:RUN domain-containing protein n=1 Tax=Tenebrio molitor TaxID=7067 RepID=A0A8J6L7M9_TENMO|nr:hypothetical protein GEV33_013862 [Tenebrio molitor]
MRKAWQNFHKHETVASPTRSRAAITTIIKSLRLNGGRISWDRLVEKGIAFFDSTMRNKELSSGFAKGSRKEDSGVLAGGNGAQLACSRWSATESLINEMTLLDLRIMSLRLMSAVISTSLPSQTKPESADKLLKQLLECVQECQKRYGGKTELATEFDSCVVALCLTLEAVLLHGLRVKPQENSQASALKQVSDIVTNSLHIGGENPSFWPFVKKHLTKHEQERYAVLKHIWTDTGRGRAWIRSSLNERSLERYFHTLLSNLDILKSHYEDYAILRDQEKSSMLPNMAAGVGSILFAVSIDKPELNSGVSHRIENLKSKAEPIIEAPISERQKIKKKKKVARQFISFDDDDSSVLSTSVPSSSSSISSDSNSANDNQSSKSSSKYHLKDIVEEKKAASKSDKMSNDADNRSAIKRTLSIETSGSREKFNSEVPETLTPISHSEIGELTPVSVEINKHFESPDVSDEILEVPTDISEVLTAVETRNKEELKKKQDKIETLLKENEILKDQVKKLLWKIWGSPSSRIIKERPSFLKRNLFR